MKFIRIQNICLFVLATLLLGSCKDEVLPKPKAMLRLQYPSPEYREIQLECGYTFEKNEQALMARAKYRKKCWYNLEYPDLKATMYLSYFKVKNNLDSLLKDAQNLTQEHVVKADEIIQEPFENLEKKVFGMVYKIKGDAASQSQFYVTDREHHFVSGSVYFKARPNYDSILPAASYLHSDIRHLLETLTWE